MKSFSKAVVACSVAVAALFSGSASAADFNPFTVQPIGPANTGSFVADKLTGGYAEIATFNANGTFNVSLLWNAGQFYTDGGSKLVKGTGLGSDYGMYATYTASGTYGFDSNGATVFTFLAGTGALNLYLDYLNNTDYSALPANGTSAFALTGTADDKLLATGDPLSGVGTLNTQLSTCGKGGPVPVGINCGSFGSATTFALTDLGSTFFIAPKPFYDLSFQSGQLNNFLLSGTTAINGSLDVVFSNAVPEPASLGLLGLGILGLGVARRRKQS